MRPTTKVRWGALVLSGALALLIAPSAQADVRYAAPGATNVSPDCPQANPCPIRTAIEGLPVADGDTILLEPGAYDLEGAGALGVADEIEIRPAQPGTRPRVVNDGEPVFFLGAAATIADLQIEASGIAGGVGAIHSEASGETVRIERTVILAPLLAGSQGIAVRRGGIELVNSAVYVGGDDSDAVEVYEVTASAIDSVIRNSTLVARGVGSVAIEATSPFEAAASHDLDVVNTILDGEGFAITTNDGGPGDGDLATEVRHSSLGTVNDPGGDGSSVSLGTGNQPGPPLLAAPIAGDFSQLAGSPTINAGVADPLSGSFDLLGGPRVFGAVIDIGADEYVPVADTSAPETTISKGPKRTQKTKKKRARAKFVFASSETGSTFECKLDSAAWRPCASPLTVEVKAKHKRKKHALQVRATDTAGNADPTPAAHRWKVKRKR
jgi:hypothetical protein